MSKQLVSIHNYTDKTIELFNLVNRDSSRGQSFAGKGKHQVDSYYKFPDNSDSARYFDEHHMTVTIRDDKFKELYSISLWNDDWQDYKIKYCVGKDWTNAKDLPGGDKGGDGTPIVLHISEDTKNPGHYLIVAVALTEDENRKEIAASFSNFKNATGVTGSGKYTSAQVHQLMKHESFGAVKEKAAGSGFGSIGLIFGKEESVVVGEENFSGVIVGFDEDGVYEIKSKAITAGAEEGEVLFAGLYMSTEPPSKVGGLDFFAEIAIDLEDVGFAFSLFTNFWSGAGFMVMLTDGEELELSVGVGSTTVTRIA